MNQDEKVTYREGGICKETNNFFDTVHFFFCSIYIWCAKIIIGNSVDCIELGHY